MDHRLGAFENPRHRVVVNGWDRIELVVMTAGAPDGHPQHALADRVELLIDDIHLKNVFVLHLVVGGTE